MGAAIVAIRLHRWTLGTVALGSLALAGVCWWMALDIAAAVSACGRDPIALSCSELQNSGTLRSQDVVKVIGLLGFLPFLGGTLVAAPLVAREIEHRTASLAWPLAVSRSRWLVRVAAPVIALGALALALPAAAGFQLVSAFAPSMDPWRTFEFFGQFGPALLFRYLAVSGLALLVGALLGRTLPAIICSGGAALALFLALGAAQPLWLESQPLPQAQTPQEALGTLFVRQMVRLPNGSLVPMEEALAQDPSLSTANGSVEFGLTKDQAPAVAWREAVALVLVASSGWGLAVVVTARRRPY